jgi:hypothetical protein
MVVKERKRRVSPAQQSRPRRSALDDSVCSA